MTAFRGSLLAWFVPLVAWGFPAVQRHPSFPGGKSPGLVCGGLFGRLMAVIWSFNEPGERLR